MPVGLQKFQFVLIYFFPFLLSPVEFAYIMSDGENADANAERRDPPPPAAPAVGGEARAQPSPPSTTNAALPFRIDLPSPFCGDGSEPFHSWIRRFEVALAVSTTPLDKAKLLPAKLSGPAFSYWQTLSPAIQNDYDSVKASLTAVFNRQPFIATFQTYLNARPRKPAEPLAVYAAELTTLVSEAFPNYDAQAKNSEVFRRFVTGLDTSLQLKIHEHGALTLEAALKVATQCERGQLAISIASPSSVMPVTVGHTALPTPSTPIAELTAAIADLRADFKSLQRSQTQTSEDRLDQLSRQVSSLRQEVSGILHPQQHACATTDYTTQRRSSDRGAVFYMSPHQPFIRDDIPPPRRQSPGRWQVRSPSHQPSYGDSGPYRRSPSPAYVRESAYGPPHYTDHYTSTTSYNTDYPSRSRSWERHCHHSPAVQHPPYTTHATYTRNARSPSPSPRYNQATPTEHPAHARHATFPRARSPSPGPYGNQPPHSQPQHRSPTRHVHFSKDTRDQGNC